MLGIITTIGFVLLAAPVLLAQDFQLELEASGPVSFTPPTFGEIPQGQFGDAVKRGINIFVNTQQAAAEFTGSNLSCANCHLGRGRLADSAPMWAAWVSYPAYRKKNDTVNTIEERIIGCFTYSMNAQQSVSGGAPAAGHPILSDLQAFMYWLATGAPTGKALAGRGYPKLKKPENGYDLANGYRIYQAQCAICHGENGEGQKVEGRQHFPPLWGNKSFNWGAGMHRINTAAGFIWANMPLGKPRSLSVNDAWDVAAYVMSHERPEDPRRKKYGAATKQKFHRHDCAYDH